MDRCYDIIILLTLRRSRASDFADIIKIVATFVKKTLKDSKKVKRIKNYVIFISTSWYNKNCWFPVKTCCVTWFIYFLDFLKVRLTVIFAGYAWQILERGLRSHPRAAIKGPSWIGLVLTKEIFISSERLRIFSEF